MYERSVYNVADVLNDIGGFQYAIYYIGLLLYQIFQGTFFFAALISKLYQMEYLFDTNKPDQVGSRRMSVDSGVSHNNS
jgi:hypothetical protein